MLDPKLLDQIIDVAAISAYKSSLLKGKGDKNAADQAIADAQATVDAFVSGAVTSAINTAIPTPGK